MEELLFTMHINIEIRKEIREWNYNDYCCLVQKIKGGIMCFYYFCIGGKRRVTPCMRELHVDVKERGR